MKIKLFAYTLTLLCSNAIAQVTTSYADVFSVTESRLSSLSNIRKVEDTAVNSVNSVSFATKVVFPEGTTSVTFNTVTYTVVKKINGGSPVTQVTGTLNGSFYNAEGDVSHPSIFGRNFSGDINIPSGTMSSTSLVARTLYITEQNISLGGGAFPKLTTVGDYYEVSRTLAGNYVGAGSVPFSVTTTARVIVVDETDVPVQSVTTVYPLNPNITSITTNEGGGTNITFTGLTIDSYQKTWWVETSTDLLSWVYTADAMVFAGLITFPQYGDTKRFWRVAGLTP